MLSILLVDDEKIIRDGLSTLVDWSKLDCQIIGVAANAQQALALLEQMTPDIIITDVKMPVMDGIGLIEEVSVRFAQIKIIVLSGYSDFDYVRTAMRLGAINYLLKPVDKEQLIVTITQIKQIIQCDAANRTRHRESLELLACNTLRRIVGQDICVSELKSKCELLGFSFHAPYYYLLVITLERAALRDENTWMRFGALNICEELFREYDCYLFLDKHDNIAVLFKAQTPCTIAYFEDLLKKCLSALRKFLDIESIAAIGECATSRRGIPQSYASAVKTLNYRLVWGNRWIYSAIELTKILDEPRVAPDEQYITQLIQSGTREELTDFINALFDDIFKNALAFNPATIKYTFMEIVLSLLFKPSTQAIEKDTLRTIKDNAYADIQTATSAMELRENMLKTIHFIFDQTEIFTQNRYSITIAKALNAIDSNYCDCNLSLKTLAQNLSVSPAYLGRQIKLVTGKHFSDYVNELRLRDAYALLRQTNQKVSQISQSVGYSSTNYFHSVFKRKYGISPNDVRQSATAQNTI